MSQTPWDDTAWHVREAQHALDALGSTIGSGLSQQEAALRLGTYGPNGLPSPVRRSQWMRLALQFHNPLIYVLLLAGVMTVALCNYIDAGVIFAVVLINAVIGCVQEGKAQKTLEAAQAILATRAMVLRDGEMHEVDAHVLVPGDILRVESGALVGQVPTLATPLLLVGELVYLFKVRYFTRSAFTRRPFTGNKVAPTMAVVLIMSQLLFTYTPTMQHVFQTASLDAASWLLIVLLGIGMFLAVEAEKWVLRRRGIGSL